MDEKKWELFSDLLYEIIHIGGTVEEKKRIIEDNVSEEALEEFISWFPADEE